MGDVSDLEAPGSLGEGFHPDPLVGVDTNEDHSLEASGAGVVCLDPRQGEAVPQVSSELAFAFVHVEGGACVSHKPLEVVSLVCVGEAARGLPCVESEPDWRVEGPDPLRQLGVVQDGVDDSGRRLSQDGCLHGGGSGGAKPRPVRRGAGRRLGGPRVGCGVALRRPGPQ